MFGDSSIRMSSFGKFKPAFFFLSVICAVVYGIMQILVLEVVPSVILLKIASILFIIGIAITSTAIHSSTGKLLVAALFCHSIGDGLIEIVSNLLFSIPFFLFGHILYGLIFYQEFLKQKYHFKAFSALDRLLLIAALLCSACIMAFLSLYMAGLTYYVIMAYICVLTLTTILAGMLWRIYPLLLLGMSLYVASDCLIAYDFFVKALILSKVLSWPLYYIAQLLITFQLLKVGAKSNKITN